MTLRRRFAWLVVFATAFGFLEAVVVVYLRELTYPEGFAFPLRLLSERLVPTMLRAELHDVPA